MSCNFVLSQMLMNALKTPIAVVTSALIHLDLTYVAVTLVIGLPLTGTLASVGSDDI